MLGLLFPECVLWSINVLWAIHYTSKKGYGYQVNFGISFCGYVKEGEGERGKEAGEGRREEKRRETDR